MTLRVKRELQNVLNRGSHLTFPKNSTGGNLVKHNTSGLIRRESELFRLIQEARQWQ